MQRLVLFVVCCSLLLVIQGQNPRPCDGPQRFEGKLITADPTKNYEFVANFSYDGIEKRERLAGKLITGSGENLNVEFILLYKQHLQYIIFPHNSTCFKTPLTKPFMKAGVPKNATFVAKLIIGGTSDPRQRLLVNTWSGENKTEGVHYFVTVTEFGCLPVSLLTNMRQSGWVLTSFFNITLGIKNSGVFVPPRYCK
ncbi:mammalian ependymin-related protein 1-like [Protopterus annectens]|uniref:mammalian ependymin-related protein 1-like n=1 Tax=Protopterus annectens TaxID=7888 RepID=UPI001CFB7A40|nr:mammalian ependymin-related protein 1-like [Protopterus annectens]